MANGPRRFPQFMPQQDEDMGLWAQDPNAGQAPAVSNNDFWGSGPGGMPEATQGFGAAPFSINRFNPTLPFAGRNDGPQLFAKNYSSNAPTEQSNVSLMHGTAPGSGSIAESLNAINRFNRSPMAGAHRNAPPYGPENEPDPKQTTQPWGGGLMKSLGGLGGLANIGMTGWGLYQQGQQIDDLRDWRQKLNERADASLAMDREKFGLVKQEYDTRSKKRQADMWSQRLDPASGGTANPYMSNLIQDA